MIWIPLAVLGLLLTSLGMFTSRIDREERKRGQKLRDKDVLRKALEKWEPLVLEHERTMRSVKQFANRARFIMNDEPDSAILGLVGLMAFDEIGMMDHPLTPIVKESDLESWKQKVSRKLAITDSKARSAFVWHWLSTLTPAQWDHYQILATQGRSRSGQ